MMTSQELRTSPLFENISYEDYRRMLTCFQAVQRSFLPEEMIYDFAGSRADAIGIVERGSASLIRIDEEGVATVLEEMGPRRVRPESGLCRFHGGQSGGGGPERLRYSVYRLSAFAAPMPERMYLPQCSGAEYAGTAQ